MTTDTTWTFGFSAGTLNAAQKVRDKFLALPPTADNATRDLLLDLYNEINETEPHATAQTEVPKL